MKKMEGGEDFKKNNKKQRLLWILTGLCVLIIILVVAIVVAINRSNGGQVESGEETESSGITEEPEVSEEEIQKEKQLMDLLDSVNMRAQGLVNVLPVDVAAINKLYDDAIEKCMSLDRKDYAINFFNDRRDVFLSKGMKREALDSMLSFDFDPFSDPDKYRLYTKIIDIAEDVGDSKVASEYEQLRSTVEEAYREDYESTRRAAEKAEAEFEEAKRIDEAILREKGDNYVGDDKEDEE